MSIKRYGLNNKKAVVGPECNRVALHRGMPFSPQLFNQLDSPTKLT